MNTQTNNQPAPPLIYLPYIWAAIIFMLLGGVFILGILFIRPNVDPLILITTVFGMAGTMFTGVAVFIKSQETHSSINGRLAEWKKDFYELARLQGVREGASEEQARVAEQLHVITIPATAAIVTSVPTQETEKSS